MLSIFRSGGAAQFIIGAVAFSIIVIFALEFRSSNRGGGFVQRTCVVEVHGYCVDTKEFVAAQNLIVSGRMTADQVAESGIHRNVIEGLVERELLVHEAELLGLEVSEEVLTAELRAGRARVSLPVRDAVFSNRARSYGRGGLELCQPDTTLECSPGVGLRLFPVLDPQTKKFDERRYEHSVREMTGRSTRIFREMQRRELLAEQMRQLLRAPVRTSVEHGWGAFVALNRKATIDYVVISRDWLTRHVIAGTDAAADAWAADHTKEVDESWEQNKARWVAGCTLYSEIHFELPPSERPEERAEATKKAEAVRARIAAGESFERVARELGPGPTATLGGFVGCVDDRLAEAQAPVQAALDAVKSGEVAAVVDAPDGVRVVRHEGTLAEKDLEARARRELARTLMVRDRAQRVADELASELIREASGGKTLEVALAAAVERLLRQAASDRGEEVAVDEAGAPRFPELSLEGAPKVERSKEFDMDGSPIPGAFGPVAESALALAAPGAVHGAPVPVSGGLAVFALAEKKEPTREEFKAEQAGFLRGLGAKKGEDAVAAFLARVRLRDATHITTHADAVAPEPARGAPASSAPPTN